MSKKLKLEIREILFSRVLNLAKLFLAFNRNKPSHFLNVSVPQIPQWKSQFSSDIG